MSLSPNAFGLSLAILTALFWGALPLALKNLLPAVDAFTIVCLRFWAAAAWVWLYPARHVSPVASEPWNRHDFLLLAIATVAVGLLLYTTPVFVGGMSAVLVVQMADVGVWRPNDRTHPAFGAALREAAAAGVEVRAYDCQVRPDRLWIDAPVPVTL